MSSPINSSIAWAATLDYYVPMIDTPGMIRQDKLAVLPLTMPEPGHALLVKNVFTAETMAAVETEIASDKVWAAFANGSLRPLFAESVSEKLGAAEAPGMKSCVELLGSAALRLNKDLNHVATETKTKNSFTPHRDDIPFQALSFLVVTSGSINYRHGGFYFAKKHYNYQRSPAQTGDVLILNNQTKYRKRPVHSGVNATGKRVILDFTIAPVWD